MPSCFWHLHEYNILPAEFRPREPISREISHLRGRYYGIQVDFKRWDTAVIIRKSNVLAKIVIPRLNVTSHYITSELEEKEREEVFRLKRVKQKKDFEKHLDQEKRRAEADGTANVEAGPKTDARKTEPKPEELVVLKNEDQQPPDNPD